MSNIINYNRQWPIFDLNLREYYDFYIAQPSVVYNPYSAATSGSCFVASFDFNNNNIFSTGATSANTIHSTVVWSDAVNGGISASTFGFTGIDNGAVTFTKYSSDTANTIMLSAMTGTTLTIQSSDTRFYMTRVTGATGNYIYPMEIVINTGITGNYLKLCGGFYQGFYDLEGLSYSVLPNRSNRGRVFSMWINSQTEPTCSGYTGTTLNDDYTDNTGFILYLGTRAENKYWKAFYGLNTGCTYNCSVPSGCTDTVTQFCTVPKEYDYVLPNGYRLDPPYKTVTDIDNQFMIYNRTTVGGTDHYGVSYPAGETAPCFTSDTISITATSMNLNNAPNQFLVYCNSCGGCNCACSSNSGDTCYTICDYSGYSSVNVMDVNSDIIDNAIGFRIKPDGSIGYRMLTMSGICSGNTVSAVTVNEGYSDPGMVPYDSWVKVDIRWFAYDYYNDYELMCGPRRLGKLCIYVNGKLKYHEDDFPEFIQRPLDTYWFTQLGVPYNISLGGGSIGLGESMTFDGQDPNDMNLYIQENFSGTFIGYISTFKIFNCDMDWVDIENAYNNEKYRYDSTVVRPNIGIYYGKLNMTSISESQLSSLNFDETETFGGVGYSFDDGLGYCYILIPYPNEPSGFKNSVSSCDGFTVPMVRMSDIEVSQVSGYVTYMVYRTFYPTNSSVDIWICE